MNKKYTLEITHDETGLHFKSENDGFAPFELYGMFRYKCDDIIKQMTGEIRPDTISRKYVEDGDK